MRSSEIDASSSFRSRISGFCWRQFPFELRLQMISVAVAWDLYEATKSGWCWGNVGLCSGALFAVRAFAAISPIATIAGGSCC